MWLCLAWQWWISVVHFNWFQHLQLSHIAACFSSNTNEVICKPVSWLVTTCRLLSSYTWANNYSSCCIDKHIINKLTWWWTTSFSKVIKHEEIMSVVRKRSYSEGGEKVVGDREIYVSWYCYSVSCCNTGLVIQVRVLPGKQGFMYSHMMSSCSRIQPEEHPWVLIPELCR